MLRKQWSRSITLDPMHYEYDGTVFHDMESVYNHAIENNFEDADTGFKLTLRLDGETDVPETKACFQLTERLGNVLLVVEEASIYFDRFHPVAEFRRLISQGRHFNVSVICVSQRVPEVDTTFRAQANSLITFLQTSPTDLDGLHDWGFDIEHVQTLEKYDRRYTLPILGVNYLCEGEQLSEYGIRAIERGSQQAEVQDETDGTQDIRAQSKERTPESDGV